MLAFQGLLSDSTITVIETARGRVIRKFDGFGPDRGVISPSFSADGKTLILGFGEDDKPSIVFFDLATGRELRRFARAEHDHGDKLQLSADGRTLVNVNHSPRTIFVYDATTGRVRHQFELNEPHDHTDWTLFRSAALSPDGKLLITTDEADAIRTWDVFEGKQIRRFEAKVEQDSLGSIAFEPGGKVVAMSASGEREGSIIRLCELATGREISRLEGHQGSVSALAFSPDGKRLASGGSDTTVLTWDVSAWI
jgi:WD40 repeat protein